MKLDTRTQNQINKIANTLMQQGFSPRTVRLRLQAEGVKWSYSVQPHPDGDRVSLQSTRELTRRLKQRRCANWDHCKEQRLGNSRLCLHCLSDLWDDPEAVWDSK